MHIIKGYIRLMDNSFMKLMKNDVHDLLVLKSFYTTTKVRRKLFSYILIYKSFGSSSMLVGLRWTLTSNFVEVLVLKLVLAFLEIVWVDLWIIFLLFWQCLIFYMMKLRELFLLF